MPTNRHRRRASIVTPEDEGGNNQQQQQLQRTSTATTSRPTSSSSAPSSRHQTPRQSSNTNNNMNNNTGNAVAGTTTKIDMTHQNSGQQVVFGLYPQHASGAWNNNDGGDNFDGSNNITKKVFYQQPDGRFTDANGELKNRQQRIAAQHQFDALRAQVPDWSADDDAKTFAPFFLYLVFAITHVRRMITGAAAGFSILILIAIYWAENLNGVSVDVNTGMIVQNSTVGGAYQTLCLQETLDAGQCSAIVAYAAVYRPASYFFLLASLLCTFFSLVPYVFDLALMRQRSTSDNIEQMQQLQGVQHHNQNNPNNNNQSANPSSTAGGVAATTTTTLPSFGDGGNNTNAKRDANSAFMLQNQSSIAPYVYMAVRHLLASTFPLFVIALISCMVTAVVEVDRRKSGSMVEITSSQQEDIRIALILRSIMFILAWVGSFRFREPTPSDEVLNANAVIDVRQ